MVAPPHLRYATFGRDHEYLRYDTVSLAASPHLRLAGRDLLTGKIVGIVADRHRSREPVVFQDLGPKLSGSGDRPSDP